MRVFGYRLTLLIFWRVDLLKITGSGLAETYIIFVPVRHLQSSWRGIWLSLDLWEINPKNDIFITSSKAKKLQYVGKMIMYTPIEGCLISQKRNLNKTLDVSTNNLLRLNSLYIRFHQLQLVLMHERDSNVMYLYTGSNYTLSQICF